MPPLTTNNRPPLPKPIPPGAIGAPVTFRIAARTDQVGVLHRILFSYSGPGIGNLLVQIGAVVVIDLDVSGWGTLKRDLVSFGEDIVVTLGGVVGSVGKLVLDFELSE